MPHSVPSGASYINIDAVGSPRLPKRWLIAGIILAAVLAAFSAASFRFDAAVPSLEKPVIVVVVLLLLAGIPYLIVLRSVSRVQLTPLMAGWVLGLGLLLRLLMLPSVPVLEDDFYRYLWDGAVLANGMNPYGHVPDQLEESVRSGDEEQARLSRLADASGEVFLRINHPYVRTIYPPIAQGAFALSYALKPWSVIPWRFVLLGADCATLLLLLHLLRVLKRPLLWCAAYWWNPLLIVAVFNAAHMDVLAYPFVLAAVCFSVRGRYQWCATFLGLAVGVKVWPVLLLPILLRNSVSRPIVAVRSAAIFALIVALFVLPYAVAEGDGFQAFRNYARRWENNDTLFRVAVWGAQGICLLVGKHPGHGQTLARAAVLLAIVASLLGLVRRPSPSGRETVRRCMTIVVVAFFLSPTQFPWYYSWILVLLPLSPHFPLLLLTPLMSLYYLQYHLVPRGIGWAFGSIVVWLEYLPVWLMMARERFARQPSMPKRAQPT